jgi:DNA invertase Pin-like site-specific DNA recombinase
MRPDIRQSLIEQQRVEAQQAALEQARATKAKTAIVGIKGSSPASGGVTTSKGSLREILEEQFAND